MTRGAWFAAAAVLIVLGVGAAASRGVFRRQPAARPHAVAKAVLASPPSRPFLMFVDVAADAAFKRVALAPLDAPDGPRYLTPLTCERVYFAGSRGLCLATELDQPGVGTSVAYVFDDQFALDDAHLLYFRPTDDGNIIWRAVAEWNEPPQPFVHEGFSPAVVR